MKYETNLDMRDRAVLLYHWVSEIGGFSAVKKDPGKGSAGSRALGDQPHGVQLRVERSL
jgi:hypothetical protein